MSSFQWDCTEFEERWFHVLTVLLTQKRQQQDSGRIISLNAGVAALEDEEDEEVDEEVDEEAEGPRVPKDLAEEYGHEYLLRKFLDRLAEVMAPEIHQKSRKRCLCYWIISMRNAYDNICCKEWRC